MTQREEISFRLGVDSRAAITGIERIQNQITRFSNDAMKKLGSIFKANVFAAATDVAVQLLPTWDEIWNTVYGVDEKTTQRLQEQSENLRKIRDNLKKSAKELADAKEKADFEDATPEGRLRMLQQKKLSADDDVREAQDEISRLREKLKAPLKPEYRAPLIDKLGLAETKLNEAQSRQFDLSRGIKKIAQGMNPVTVESIFDEMLRNSIPAVGQLRAGIKKDAALENAYRRSGAPDLAAQAAESKAQKISDIGTITQARAVSNLDDIASKIPDANILDLKLFKESLLEAQRAAMTAIVQKVEIVHVNVK